MSLIYAVIARGTDTTLVDYEAKHSNFPKLAQTLLTKIKQNNRQTYLYNQNYYFHYINEDDFTYLCLTDKIFPKRSAFAFLEEIKQIFQDKYDFETRINAISYAMRETFTENLKAKMIYYNSDPDNEKIQRLQNNLIDVKDHMIENIGNQLFVQQLNLDKILDREEQIQILVQKTNTMNQYASAYKNTAVAVRRDQEWRSLKTKLFVGGVVGSILIVAAIIIF